MTNSLTKLAYQLNNAYAGRLARIECNSTNIVHQVLHVLYDEGYILGYTSATRSCSVKRVQVHLKYANCSPAITEVKLASTPGHRVYWNLSMVTDQLRRRCLVIISTSRGVLTLAKAHSFRLGGEPLIIVS